MDNLQTKSMALIVINAPLINEKKKVDETDDGDNV